MIEAFLRRHGITAPPVPLAGDASTRRYWRVSGAVLMEAPRDPKLPTFVTVAAWLRDQGLHAPEVLGVDETDGLVLLEDLGDDLLSLRLQAGELELPLYRLVLDAMLRWQSVTPPDFLPPFDDATLIDQVSLFLEHGCPDGDPGTFRQAWAEALRRTDLGPPVFLHRDLHAANLLEVAGAEGLWRLGIIDFQDAFKGPALYDLVSLIEDVRRDVGDGTREVLVRGWREANPGVDDAGFGAAWAVLGAQRAMRILAVVERLATVGGKPTYRALEPRATAHLRRHLGHPALAALRTWCLHHAPGLFA